MLWEMLIPAQGRGWGCLLASHQTKAQEACGTCFIISWSERNEGDLNLPWPGAPIGRACRWLGSALAPRREMGMKGRYPELT